MISLTIVLCSFIHNRKWPILRETADRKIIVNYHQPGKRQKLSSTYHGEFERAQND